MTYENMELYLSTLPSWEEWTRSNKPQTTFWEQFRAAELTDDPDLANRFNGIKERFRNDPEALAELIVVVNDRKRFWKQTGNPEFAAIYACLTKIGYVFADCNLYGLPWATFHLHLGTEPVYRGVLA